MVGSMQVISPRTWAPRLKGSLKGATTRCARLSPRQSTISNTTPHRLHNPLLFNGLSCHGSVARLYSSVAGQQQASAIVVGAGAAGIAVLGNLLENIDRGKIVWVDPQFKGGRINQKYREVPSNTKVGLFLAYAQATKPFQDVLGATAKPNAATALEALPQDSTCSLSYAGDMLQMLSDGLGENQTRVDRQKGNVVEANWIKETSEWSLKIQGAGSGQSQEHRAPLVVYCTGASPTTVTLPTPSTSSPELLDLDIALKPSALTQSLPHDKQVTVGVVGASHSAILVLMNLVKLSQTTHAQIQVRWFTRSSKLRYAIYKDGQIFYDNTGLKGEAAQFAREQLDGEMLATSESGKVIKRVDCSGGVESEREAMSRELPSCDYVIQAVGFTNHKLPAMKQHIRFDHLTGGFVDAKSGSPVPGLFGAGIAFPEKVVGPAGNEEYAVGFFKFMKFLKRVVPEWVAKTS